MEADGLVRKRPLSGYTTTPLLSRAEFDDLFDVRLLLEGATAGRAATHASTEERQRITAEAAASIDVEAGDGYRRHAAFTALDARFHDLIAEVAGSPCCATASRGCTRTCTCTGCTFRSPALRTPTPSTNASPPPSPRVTPRRPPRRCGPT